MELNAEIFEHVTKMGRIGTSAVHKSEPVYRQLYLDDLPDTPTATDRSIRKPDDIAQKFPAINENNSVDMKLGRNMRARPRKTTERRSNKSDKDLIESLNKKQTLQQFEVEDRQEAEADQKEKRAAIFAIPSILTDSDTDLAKSKNGTFKGVRTEKDNDDNDSFLEKIDTSKDDDLNDF